MFAEETLLSILFRLFNFGLIIALAMYCFKIYILPSIITAITKEESEKEHVLHEQEDLKNYLVSLDDCIKKDNETCEFFKIKIDRWRQAVDSTRIAYEKKCLERNIEFRRKREHILELQKKTAFQAYAADKVATDLERSLSTYFDENKDAAVQYIENVVTFMRERVQ